MTWSRINPKLKDLASEEYPEREANLFGPGFLEKASKRLEVEKTLSKVTNEGKPNNQYGHQPSKRPRFGENRFLSKGTSARGGSTRSRLSQPSQYNQFRSRRYFQKGSAAILPKNKRQEKSD